jgi:WD40 repeat protein
VYCFDLSQTGNTVSSLEHSADITCVAIHPSEDSFAIGDSRGRIFVWYGFGFGRDKNAEGQSTQTLRYSYDHVSSEVIE